MKNLQTLHAEGNYIIDDSNIVQLVNLTKLSTHVNGKITKYNLFIKKIDKYIIYDVKIITVEI